MLSEAPRERNGSAAAAGRARRHNFYCIFWRIAPARSVRAAVRLEPVLGGAVDLPVLGSIPTRGILDYMDSSKSFKIISSSLLEIRTKSISVCESLRLDSSRNSLKI